MTFIIVQQHYFSNRYGDEVLAKIQWTLHPVRLCFTGTNKV